ncbi:hypothetical protein TBLA_0A07510 [Henningerozyma blattae CBS 6284]|uniref:Mitochondrial inner membrane i-AAA protease complex subunit MGR1 n=1 Tax=Henningerozyma blattae (strain ATCC 34711 / CBS 6284 / DSM 70876 / NBRC 10599 / NRRL Y-10934 / UCD 77-7) TaxID=1071380 RepID=I2GWN9_HENB6|nr:hypothetical protein TBLA_0A07510 [Tetrapisispora blattae CBS 6284]CCH58541.1 hypothetical protein TBLA_0A07510 [Tetrapisispora blattae CBS 6284]
MAVYTPPNKSTDNSSKSPTDTTDDSSRDIEKFYIRPSLGLKMWGPLVPASDNKTGLWALVGTQTVIGILCVQRFRMLRLRPISQSTSTLGFKKLSGRNIADIPSLNRFSTANGSLMTSSKPKIFQLISQFKLKSSNSYKQFKTKYQHFSKYIYLLFGSVILFQSSLETLRLTIIKYDPWCEEVKSLRNKKLFNDLIKFYHEGIDPNKVKVKDATSGNILSINIPEVKQSVALVRAQAESQNPIIKWFGPIQYKPMSFSDYLDQLEFHLDMLESFQKKNSVNEASEHLRNQLANTDEEIQNFIKKNKENREKALKYVINSSNVSFIDSSDSQPNENSEADITERKKLRRSNRSIILGPDKRNITDLDIPELWTMYNPWTSLALDTSLSIKFLPTVVSPESSKEESDKMLPGENDPDNDTTELSITKDPTKPTS